MRDLALAAILEVAVPTQVGDFFSEDRTDDVVVVRFSSLHPGYPGWHWSAAIVDNAGRLTVNEVWMEPGLGALPIPTWKPWSERVRPGDLGAGDVVPTDPNDARITPGYTAEDEGSDDELLAPAQWEPGLGRARVLSVEGLADAAERWRSGDEGPDSQVARLADHPCSTCAWLLPIGGLLGQAFGVCAHDMSPSDGHVVSLDHGCGAHSDVRIEPSPIPVTDMLIDETTFISVRMDRAADAEALGEDLRSEEVGAQSEAEPTSAPATAEGVELAEAQRSDGSGTEGLESAVEALASTNDVSHAEETDEHAGQGDITPPQDIVVAEVVAEHETEQGE